PVEERLERYILCRVCFAHTPLENIGLEDSLERLGAEDLLLGMITAQPVVDQTSREIEDLAIVVLANGFDDVPEIEGRDVEQPLESGGSAARLRAEAAGRALIVTSEHPVEIADRESRLRAAQSQRAHEVGERVREDQVVESNVDRRET